MYVCMYVHTAPFCPRDLRARCDTGLGFENVDSIIPWQVHESAAAAAAAAAASTSVTPYLVDICMGMDHSRE